MIRSKNIILYLSLFTLLAVATIVRVYKTNFILGFYYDQGRDAMVVAELLENGKWFLIGPTTGIAGIFRGPFYYYLITPFYWLGRGNPVYPAVFLELTSVVALIVVYRLGRELSDRTTGLIAVFLGALSYYIIYASRWLSNPTPMLLLSVLLLYCIFKIQRGKQWAWIPLSFIAGASQFHFGSSGEFFYFPALLIFALWQWGFFRFKVKLPNIKIILLSLLAFFITFAPLLVFDLRHEHILSQNLLRFFGTDGSFGAVDTDFISKRINFLVYGFYSKFFISQEKLSLYTMALVLLVGISKMAKQMNNTHIRALLLVVIAPFIGFIFFRGNEGNVYDYYLTGYYLLFVLVVAMSLRETLKIAYLGPIIVSVFVILFLQQNVPLILNYTNDKLDDPTSIAYGNELQAISWIYTNAQGEKFNADEYVPPVIQYSYNYLFHWYDREGLGLGYALDTVPLLYTIYEVDPPHPERLNAWLMRQNGIGKVMEETRFGGITVQKRIRITK